MQKKGFLFGLFALIVSSFITSATYAGDSSSGCGLGWQVLPKNSLVSSFTRSMINATFSNTIAMTLGTSGCARHSIVYNEKKGIHFVEANKEVLVAEMAQGQGEYIVSMSEVFGCQNSSELGKILQKNYTNLVTGFEVSGVELYQNIKNNQDIKSVCPLI